MADKTEFEAQRDVFVAASASQPFDRKGSGHFALVPDGYSLQSLEAYQDQPNRIRADERFVDVLSLVEYLNRFATNATMISAHYEHGKISAVLDGHSPADPSHRDHKARFEAQLSDRLKAWLAIDGKAMGQIDFGLFLEDRAVDVVQPDSADVMDMVMQFDATKKVSFKSSTRLHDGQRQFQYVEENETRGAVTLPDHFIIFAPVYRGMEPQRIKFMVRYRIEEGKLRFVVQMHDKDTVMREAFDRCVDALRTGMKVELPIYVVG
jgi:uncharacterized protein YfdQ (DUF2303 family)